MLQDAGSTGEAASLSARSQRIIRESWSVLPGSLERLLRTAQGPLGTLKPGFPLCLNLCLPRTRSFNQHVCFEGLCAARHCAWDSRHREPEKVRPCSPVPTLKSREALGKARTGLTETPGQGRDWVGGGAGQTFPGVRLWSRWVSEREGCSLQSACQAPGRLEGRKAPRRPLGFIPREAEALAVW